MTVEFGDKRLPERFWSKIRIDEPSRCWIWTASLKGGGYGQFSWKGKAGDYAHRVAYLELIGPIEKPLQCDHLCMKRSCCNPNHIELVTNRENTLRGLAVFNGAHQRAKTFCPQGHPYLGENLYVQPNGDRICRECNRAKQRRYTARNRDLINAKKRLRRAAKKAAATSHHSR